MLVGRTDNQACLQPILTPPFNSPFLHPSVHSSSPPPLPPHLTSIKCMYNVDTQNVYTLMTLNSPNSFQFQETIFHSSPGIFLNWDVNLIPSPGIV